MGENPFRVLGLDRDLIRRLDDKTCSKLVEQQFRFLQKVFHPDVGGDPRFSRELNEARGALDLERNPESFARYKSAYARKAAGSVERESLKARAGLAQVGNDRLFDSLQDYLRCSADPAGQESIFTPGPLTIGLNDLVLGRMLPINYRREGRSQVFFDLHKSREGAITAQRVGRPAERYEGRVLAGTVPHEVEAFGPHNPMARLLQQIAPDGTREGERFTALPRQPGKTLDLRRISPGLLRPVGEYFTPFLKQDAALFSASTDEQGLCFRLEGRIYSITRS